MKIKQALQSQYVFTVDYRKGTLHGVPDALSRSPVDNPDKDGHTQLDFGRIASITGEIGIKDLNMAKLEEQARKDDRYKALHDAVVSGF